MKVKKVDKIEFENRVAMPLLVGTTASYQKKKIDVKKLEKSQCPY